MPHNRTRIWVGLAIAAVTIPAIGEFYYGSATQTLRGTPITGGARLASEGHQSDSFGSGLIAMHASTRDYRAELNAALGRQGALVPESVPLESEDTDFGLSPDATSYFDSPEDSDGPTAGRVAPDQPQALAPTLAYSTEGPVDDSASDPIVADPSTDVSDATIYRLVVDNLPQDQRDEFVRAYAAMTPDQRAELMDGFRTQIQGSDRP